MCKELDIIVAMGGDGTVNEVAAGVTEVRHRLQYFP